MSATETDERVRLDKWLWAARFYKTRTIAKQAIEGGKVHYDNQRTKPGKLVETGAELRLRLGWRETCVVIDAISDRRRGAPEARLLYHETKDSIKKRDEEAWRRKTMQAAHMPPPRRPNKKDRRRIQRFKDEHGF